MSDLVTNWSPLGLPEVMETILDISSRLEIQHVLNAVVRHAVRLLNAQSSTLAVCEPGTNLARVVALYNVPFEYEELVLRPGASAASHVLITGKPIIINDLRLWAEDRQLSGEGPDFECMHYDAILAVPLVWENRVMGSLTVMDRGGSRPFTDNDTRVLSLLAKLASTALNNAQLYSQVVQLNQQLEHKVEERTRELAGAQEELAKKAEQLQQLLGTTVFLQEEERARIARDLHDGSNQLITGTMYEIQAALQSMQANRPEVAAEKLQTAKALLRQINDENRRIISDLRPPILDTHGLVTALRRLAERYREYSGVKYEIKVSGQPVRLSERTETTVYRILQESLNNISAHSNAQTVEICLDFQAIQLLVLVNDDGVGFEVNIAAAKNRLGLIGMRERAQSINGRLEVQSEPGKGTNLLLEVPLASEPESKISSPGASDCQPESKPRDISVTKNAHPVVSDIKKEHVRWEKPTSKDYSVKKQVPELAVRCPKISMIAHAIEELQEETAFSLVHGSLDAGTNPLDILNYGVMTGLKAIGKRFESKYYFLGELLIGAKLAEACIGILETYLPKGKIPTRGVVVIGAVQGDIHSIGVGLVAKQLELAGYKVHKLGINVPSMTFIEKAEEFKADIIALSAFLVTTIPYCKEVINYLQDMGIREKYQVIIGGSETSNKVARAMGADGWAGDAIEAVRLCDLLLGHTTNPPL